MFKDWIRDIFNLGAPENENDDVNIDIAKANYQKYQDELKQQQKEYIKILCNEIKKKSRTGHRYIWTDDYTCTFMTPEFMAEMKEYFEQRGFCVAEKNNGYGVRYTWLEIRWD